MRRITATSQALWLPKGGHGTDEYEDAFRLPVDEALPLRTAVADGATESAFARTWALLLVEGFVTQGCVEPAAFGEHLRRWQGVWRAVTASRTDNLPWYAAAKVEQGAFAAFAGLVLHEDRSWRALAVGDCCLFHLRTDDVLLAWPIERPEQFDNHPALLPSLPERAVPPPQARAGAWRPGDVFLLATDALAAWLMRIGPTSALAWTPESFRERVVAARAARALRNDDVTLIVVRCPSSVVCY